MTPRWHVDVPGFYGLGAEPIRTPLAGAFVVGPSALPTLGQEGELLAAWSAARLITRTDKRKERMRRDMWSKIELG
jgi:hypothetical protein